MAHPQDAVHWRADLVAQVGEELRLGAVGAICRCRGVCQRSFPLVLRGQVDVGAGHAHKRAIRGAHDARLRKDPSPRPVDVLRPVLSLPGRGSGVGDSLGFHRLEGREIVWVHARVPTLKRQWRRLRREAEDAHRLRRKVQRVRFCRPVPHAGVRGRHRQGKPLLHAAHRPHRPPQLHLCNRLPPQGFQRLDLLGGQMPLQPVDDAQGAHSVTIGRQQRDSGVEANAQLASDQRIVGEARIFSRRGHVQRGRMQDRMRTKRDVARGLLRR